MSSTHWPVVFIILFHLSFCWASSDPHAYNNKSQLADESGKTFYLNLSDLIYGQSANKQVDQVMHLTAQDFQNALTIDTSVDASPRGMTENRDLFDGDIRSTGQLRNAIIGLNYRWPKATIPYVVSTSFNSDERSVIAKAMMEYHEKTCIRFVPRTNQPDYIIFKTTGSGCNSNVGRTGGSQVVSLDQGCVHVGLIIHELMHAAGFFHEQARTDRDDYVVVNWSNIQEGNQRNFDKLKLSEIEYLGTKYDTGSVMHYDKFAFAKDRSVPTIYSKTGSTLGNTQGFSQNDIVKINRMYHCVSGEVTTTMATTTTVTAGTTTSGASTTGLQTDGTTAMPFTDGTTTATVYEDKKCVDSMDGCDLFAGDGFCTTSIDLMTTFCKKTCGLCPIVGKVCFDKNPNCFQWALSGQCIASANFMMANCPKSCNTCK